jgi:hypothetical protein
MSPPAEATGQPPSDPRGGCLSVLMVVGGIVMLLPGLCAIILIGLDPHEMMVDPSVLFAMVAMLAISGGGIALIWWALTRR